MLKENAELDRKIEDLKEESRKLDKEKERLLLEQAREEKSGYRGYLH